MDEPILVDWQKCPDGNKSYFIGEINGNCSKEGIYDAIQAIVAKLKPDSYEKTNKDLEIQLIIRKIPLHGYNINATFFLIEKPKPEKIQCT